MAKPCIWRGHLDSEGFVDFINSLISDFLELEVFVGRGPPLNKHTSREMLSLRSVRPTVFCRNNSTFEIVWTYLWFSERSPEGDVPCLRWLRCWVELTLSRMEPRLLVFHPAGRYGPCSLLGYQAGWQVVLGALTVMPPVQLISDFSWIWLRSSLWVPGTVLGARDRRR